MRWSTALRLAILGGLSLSFCGCHLTQWARNGFKVGPNYQTPGDTHAAVRDDLVTAVLDNLATAPERLIERRGETGDSSPGDHGLWDDLERSVDHDLANTMSTSNIFDRAFADLGAN